MYCQDERIGREVDWKAVIIITGTVPAQLQGTLFYTYGKGNEFYPSTEFPFTVALEGGIESDNAYTDSDPSIFITR